jgi:hypothetical protein
LAGIEVKPSAIVSGKDIRPLLALREDYPQAKVCLLYGGKDRLKVNDVICLPCEQFLRDLVPDSPLPLG